MSRSRLNPPRPCPGNVFRARPVCISLTPGPVLRPRDCARYCRCAAPHALACVCAHGLAYVHGMSSYNIPYEGGLMVCMWPALQSTVSSTHSP